MKFSFTCLLYLASGSRDFTIRIWNNNNGETTKVLKFHKGFIYSLILLSNGNLASASADKTIVIWNIKNSEILRVLTGHTGEIYTLALLPDFIIASGSLDRFLNSSLTILKEDT